jgi:uncharacterized phage protein (TIGR02216 family)
MLKAGHRLAGLRPWEVWKLTPAELLILIGVENASKPMGRRGLETLLENFPDHNEER